MVDTSSRASGMVCLKSEFNIMQLFYVDVQVLKPMLKFNIATKFFYYNLIYYGKQ
jgi:hypothetical protein